MHHTFSTNVQLFLLIIPFYSNLLYNTIFLVKHIEAFGALFSTSMITPNCLDLFFSLIFCRSFENFELIKHAKLSLHGVFKNVFLEKSLMKVLKYFYLSMKCCHGTTQVQELFLHKTNHSKEIRYDVFGICIAITKI
jgi:hypothetical protein